MQELEEERERRWKAEQAARKLVDTVKEMQEKSKSTILLISEVQFSNLSSVSRVSL